MLTISTLTGIARVCLCVCACVFVCVCVRGGLVSHVGYISMVMKLL